MVRFVINFVNNFWDFDFGDIIIVMVKDFVGYILVINLVGNFVFVFDFNFFYYVK